MKYIVKNCPACVISPSVCSEWHIKNGGKAKDCQDISDCLIKQVIEKCKSVDCDCIVDRKNCGQMDFLPMCCDLWKSKDILQLFEIEECEE